MQRLNNLFGLFSNPAIASYDPLSIQQTLIDLHLSKSDIPPIFHDIIEKNSREGVDTHLLSRFDHYITLIQKLRAAIDKRENQSHDLVWDKIDIDESEAHAIPVNPLLLKEMAIILCIHKLLQEPASPNPAPKGLSILLAPVASHYRGTRLLAPAPAPSKSEKSEVDPEFDLSSRHSM